MNEITKLDTVQHYCDLFGIEALHPLISIVDCDKMSPIRHGRRLYNLYAVLLKDTDCGTMSYGRSLYDYEKGTVLLQLRGKSWELMMTVNFINRQVGHWYSTPNCYGELRWQA